MPLLALVTVDVIYFQINVFPNKTGSKQIAAVTELYKTLPARSLEEKPAQLINLARPLWCLATSLELTLPFLAAGAGL